MVLGVPEEASLPRVLVVSNLFPPDVAGGAEIVASRQALALAKRGHYVEVFAGFRPSSPSQTGTLETDLWNGLRVHRLGLRSLGLNDNFHWGLAERYFEAVLSVGRFDVVHFHNVMGLGMGLIAMAAAHGARTVVTVHDHWGFCFHSTLLRDGGAICTDFDECHGCRPAIDFETNTALPMRLRRDYVFQGLAVADRLVFPSRYMAKVYATAGFDAKRMHVISNGIDVERFRTTPTPSAKVRFLTLAYLGEHKGLLVLLDALKLLANDDSISGDWVFKVGGSGHLEDLVRREAASHKLNGRLEFLGKVPMAEVPDLYRDTDVVVLPSIWPENEPVTLLEAIAAGRAQLATDVGGHPDLLKHEVTGALVATGDAHALATAMRAYIEVPNLAVTHGRANARRRELFDESAAIGFLSEVYAIAPPSGRFATEMVICVGREPLPYVRGIVENWHVLAPELNSVRFVSAAWMGADYFAEARAIWFWSPDIDQRMMLDAVRSGRPILVPAGSSQLGALRAVGAPVLIYEDGLQAMSMLMATVASNEAHGWLASSAAAADLLAVSLKRQDFLVLAKS